MRKPPSSGPCKFDFIEPAFGLCVGRYSPERRAREYAPAEQNRREDTGDSREKPLLSAVIQGQEWSDQTEQTASQQEEGYDPRSVFRGFLCCYLPFL